RVHDSRDDLTEGAAAAMEHLDADERGIRGNTHRADILAGRGHDSGDVCAVPEAVRRVADAVRVTRLVEVERLTSDERCRMRDVEIGRDVDVCRANAAVENGDARAGASVAGIPGRGRGQRIGDPLRVAECFGGAEAGCGLDGCAFPGIDFTGLDDAFRLHPLNHQVFSGPERAFDLGGASRELRIVRAGDGDADLIELRCQRATRRAHLSCEIGRQGAGKVDDVRFGGWYGDT